MRALLILLLAGCSSNPAIPEVTKVPVVVSCVKNAPAKPATASEREILAMDDYAGTLTVWTERLLLKAYAEKTEAVIMACL